MIEGLKQDVSQRDDKIKEQKETIDQKQSDVQSITDKWAERNGMITQIEQIIGASKDESLDFIKDLIKQIMTAMGKEP